MGYEDLMAVKEHLAEWLRVGVSTHTDSDGDHHVTVQLFLDGVEVSSETNYLFHK